MRLHVFGAERSALAGDRTSEGGASPHASSVQHHGRVTGHGQKKPAPIFIADTCFLSAILEAREAQILSKMLYKETLFPNAHPTDVLEKICGDQTTLIIPNMVIRETFRHFGRGLGLTRTKTGEVEFKPDIRDIGFPDDLILYYFLKDHASKVRCYETIDAMVAAGELSNPQGHIVILDDPQLPEHRPITAHQPITHERQPFAPKPHTTPPSERVQMRRYVKQIYETGRLFRKGDLPEANTPYIPPPPRHTNGQGPHHTITGTKVATVADIHPKDRGDHDILKLCELIVNNHLIPDDRTFAVLTNDMGLARDIRTSMRRIVDPAHPDRVRYPDMIERGCPVVIFARELIRACAHRFGWSETRTSQNLQLALCQYREVAQFGADMVSEANRTGALRDLTIKSGRTFRYASHPDKAEQPNIERDASFFPGQSQGIARTNGR